jgi:hypothetical protein
MSELASYVAERDLELRLPYIGNTKAEVVRWLMVAGVPELAASTVSCVHYPVRESGRQQCGLCAACILRRQALRAAGLDDPSRPYRYDLFGNVEQFRSVPPKHLRMLRAILLQQRRLARLSIEDALADEVGQQILVHSGFTNNRCGQEVVAAYCRYGREWDEFFAIGRRNGAPWAEFGQLAGSVN